MWFHSLAMSFLNPTSSSGKLGWVRCFRKPNRLPCLPRSIFSTWNMRLLASFSFSCTCKYHGIQVVRVKHSVGVFRHLLLTGSLKILSILLLYLTEPKGKTWWISNNQVIFWPSRATNRKRSCGRDLSCLLLPWKSQRGESPCRPPHHSKLCQHTSGA